MALHWVLVPAWLGLFAWGWYMTTLPFSPWRLQLYNWHKWAGMGVLALSLLRLGWRLWHPPPALPRALQQAMPAWQRRLHQGVHLALYALFLAVPLLGWTYSSAAGFPVVLFGVWPLPDLVPVRPEWVDLLKALHRLAAYSLMALVGLHVAGALKHALLDRDGLLARMGLGRP
jgi:cytochrome b561